MVAIIDYDAGNIKSVENAVRFLGHDVKVTADPGEILAADHIILPGVGAFGDAMKRLRAAGLEENISEAVRSDASPKEMGEKYPRLAGTTLPSPERAVFSTESRREATSISYIPIIWRRAILRTLLPAPNMV